METAPAIDGDALRAARERAGLSQNELARHLGMASGQRVSRWERGEARPRSPGILHAIADALDVSPVHLLVPPESGPTLRWFRFVAGLTVPELAEAIHTSVPTVKRWEADGLRSPGTTTVSALASALDVAPGEIREALAR